jgi:hypothetical protein
MTGKKDATQEWLDLDASLDEDLLTEAYSDEEVDTLIRAKGKDPVAVGQRGVALAQRLLDAQRLAWMQRAREKQEEMRAAVGGVHQERPRSRAEMMDFLAAARADPRLGGRLEGFWRKRRPEESSDDELGELVTEIEALQRLVDAELKPEKKK